MYLFIILLVFKKQNITYKNIELFFIYFKLSFFNNEISNKLYICL